MHVLKEWFGGRVRIVLLLMILFAVGVCGASIGVDLWQEWRTPPEVRVTEALQNAMAAPTYCYTGEAVRVHEGKEQVITRLKGEKNGEAVHLYGTVDVLDTELDVYQISDNFYRKDIVSGQWMKMTGQNLEATEYLMQEINPLGCLVTNDTAQVTELGKEKLNGATCKKYQMQYSGENTFLTSVWKEFYYTVWLDKKHRLQQVEIIADDHENSAEQLRLMIQFDWNAEVSEIKAPV